MHKPYLAPMRSICCLETTALSYRYANGDGVLHGITLQVPQGGIYAFLGPNGAGKTTTLRLVLGLLKPRAGQIAIFGQALATHRLENLAVWQKIYRCTRERIAEVLHLVGLPKTGAKKAGRFSLGMKQRLGIAVALLHNPSLLILDEPTNGLDPHGIIEIRDLLTALNRECGVTIVISSHLLAEVEKLATHVGIIHQGRMVFQGTMENLRQKQRQFTSICFDTTDNEKALGVIARYAPAARRKDGKIFAPPLSVAQIARVNRTLVEDGLEVHEIRTYSDDLETIFMSLVGESVP